MGNSTKPKHALNNYTKLSKKITTTRHMLRNTNRELRNLQRIINTSNRTVSFNLVYMTLLHRLQFLRETRNSLSNQLSNLNFRLRRSLPV